MVFFINYKCTIVTQVGKYSICVIIVHYISSIKNSEFKII